MDAILCSNSDCQLKNSFQSIQIQILFVILQLESIISKKKKKLMNNTKIALVENATPPYTNRYKDDVFSSITTYLAERQYDIGN